VAKRTIVLVPAPTANGDLHIGHIAGPFLASDTYVRFLRATGQDVLYATGIQDTQTFVVTTARRLGVSTERLSTESEVAVRRGLDAMGISLDALARCDDRFRRNVLNLLGRLRAAGKLRLKSMPFPQSTRTGEYLVDAYVRGACPHCLADGCGGICESCGHPISPGDLLDLRSTLDPDDVLVGREVPVLVMPIEEYRSHLAAFFDGQAELLRPHMLQVVREMLARPLADYPITYPIGCGIPAPFPEVAGQVISPWAEVIGRSFTTSSMAAESHGAVLASDDELWLAGSGTSTVYFCGFDNIHTFAILAFAQLMACDGRYVLPQALVTNEFYELENAKFSTSSGHVLGCVELAAAFPRDGIRFYLAATSPEYQRTNFGVQAMVDVVRRRLATPWNRLVAAVNPRLDGGAEAMPISDRARASAALMVDRFRANYQLAGFSLNRTAETITNQLDRLQRLATSADAAPTIGDVCYQVEIFVRCAAPVLIDLADQVLGVPGPHAIPELPSEREVRPRRLPPFPAFPAAVPGAGTGDDAADDADDASRAERTVDGRDLVGQAG
jgi:methionyl-tRNA synthetase